MSTSLSAQEEWSRHQRTESISDVDMWEWGWMQDEGELRIPGLGPCIGLMIYEPGIKLAIGGHFPVRRGTDRTDRGLSAMLSHAKTRVDLGAASLWMGGGVLLPEEGIEYPISLGHRLALNARTREHRAWMQEAVADHLGRPPIEGNFYEHPVAVIDYSVNVATGGPRLILNTRE